MKAVFYWNTFEEYKENRIYHTQLDSSVLQIMRKAKSLTIC